MWQCFTKIQLCLVSIDLHDVVDGGPSDGDPARNACDKPDTEKVSPQCEFSCGSPGGVFV